MFLQTNTTLKEIRLPLNGALVLDKYLSLASLMTTVWNLHAMDKVQFGSPSRKMTSIKSLKCIPPPKKKKKDM